MKCVRQTLIKLYGKAGVEYGSDDLDESDHGCCGRGGGAVAGLKIFELGSMSELSKIAGQGVYVAGNDIDTIALSRRGSSSA